MGWNSANDIFDRVAREILKIKDAFKDLTLAAEVATQVLSVLIDTLQAGDWDTEDESLYEFRDHPEIVEAFRLNGITLGEEDA